LPNPDLSPEYSCNAELSATRILNEKIELSGTVFYSLLRNAMVRDDFAVNGRDSILYDGVMSRVRALVNSGRANIYGFNLGIKADLANAWSASASFNITEGRDLENDEPLRHTTPPFGLVSINYAQSRISAEFYVRFNGARKLENMPESERLKTHIYSSEGSLAWYTLNLRVHYKATDWFGIDAAFENILNHHYRTYSSGISAPGRNLSVSFRGYF
jgi:hemoglobin/transferrin/lactoferrin receptor protein